MFSRDSIFYGTWRLIAVFTERMQFKTSLNTAADIKSTYNNVSVEYTEEK
jgi:hypothetical protein